MKKILYISFLCSPELLEYIFATAVRKPLLSIQKFHRLFAEGFGASEDCTVTALSAVPVVRATHRKIFWLIAESKFKGVTYKVVPTVNLPLLKNLFNFVFTFCGTLIWSLGNRKDKLVVCDVINLSITTAAQLACKLAGVKVAAIITDVPNFSVRNTDRTSLTSRIWYYITDVLRKRFDIYILLTEQMNSVVNLLNKPYLIMEGLVDHDMETVENRLEDKDPERIIIYAGGIYEKYGVKTFIEAFMRLEGDDLRLYIYGPGPMASDMPEYCRKDGRINYFGVVENDIVVRQQLKATLSVNPRPTTEEITKYSFPSKNMEAMVSGTPLLTTKLPGMPADHYPYVYMIEDESVEGMYKILRLLMDKSREELHEFGLKTKEFVLKNKNNHIQAKRLINLFEKCQLTDKE